MTFSGVWKSYRINRQGFRGDDFTYDKSGLRVAVLGNSCSFGWGVGDSETFADRLQEMLRRQPGLENAQVYNFSVPGYSSYQGKINYQKNIRPYHPDIILATFGWNDQWLAADGRADKDQKMPPQALLDIDNIAARLRLYRWFESLWFSSWAPGDTATFSLEFTRVSLPDFKDNLGEIIRMAREDGARVILLTSPIPPSDQYNHSRHELTTYGIHGFFNDMTREAAATYGTELVDLAAIFDRGHGLFDDVDHDPYHYNSRGHDLAAREIFPVILSLVGADSAR
jgi:lysophospholipase L1-like esterase